MSPELLFWYELALKMALTAAIVVAASVAVERSGPFVGALIAALPTAAGAAYVILGFEHPASFVAASAIGSLAAQCSCRGLCACLRATRATTGSRGFHRCCAGGLVYCGGRPAHRPMERGGRARAQYGRIRSDDRALRPLPPERARPGDNARALRSSFARAHRLR